MKVGFLGLLTILFIGLKLTGYIGWSWVWVLAPMWIGFAALIVVAILIAALQTWKEYLYVKDGKRH